MRNSKTNSIKFSFRLFVEEFFLSRFVVDFEARKVRGRAIVETLFVVVVQSERAKHSRSCRSRRLPFLSLILSTIVCLSFSFSSFPLFVFNVRFLCVRFLFVLVVAQSQSSFITAHDCRSENSFRFIPLRLPVHDANVRCFCFSQFSQSFFFRRFFFALDAWVCVCAFVSSPETINFRFVCFNLLCWCLTISSHEHEKERRSEIVRSVHRRFYGRSCTSMYGNSCDFFFLCVFVSIEIINFSFGFICLLFFTFFFFLSSLNWVKTHRIMCRLARTTARIATKNTLAKRHKIKLFFR